MSGVREIFLTAEDFVDDAANGAEMSQLREPIKGPARIWFCPQELRDAGQSVFVPEGTKITEATAALELHSHQRQLCDWVASKPAPGSRFFMLKSRKVGVGAMLARELHRIWFERLLAPDVEAAENGMGC